MIYGIISLIMCVGIPVLGGIYLSGAGKAGVLVISGRYAVFCIDTAGCAASSAAVSEHPLGLVYAFALYRIFSLYGPSGNFGRIV